MVARRTAVPASVPATVGASITPVVTAARFAARLRLGEQSAALGEVQNLALVQPGLNPDHAVSSVRFGKTVVDIRAQRVQRKLALQIPFAARDFGAVETAGNPHLNALAAETQRRIHGLAHRPPERYALFQLERNRLRHQLRIELGLVNLLNVDEDFALGLLRHVLLELFDLGALPPDDDARPRRADRDPQLVAGPVDFNRADPGRLQPVAQVGLQLQIFLQQLGIAVRRKPTRAPGLVEAQPKSVR